MASWRTGDPVFPRFQPTPSKRSPALAPKRRQVSSWWPPRMFTAKWPLSRIAGQVVDVCAMQTRTSGGSRETDVNELAAMPAGPFGPCPVTIVTPVAKCPRTVRKRALSMPSSTVSGGSGSGPDGSISDGTLPGRPDGPRLRGAGRSAGRRPVVAVRPGHGRRAGGEDEGLHRRQVLDAPVDEAHAARPHGHGERRVEVQVREPAEGVGEVGPHGRLAHQPPVGA